MVGVVHTELAVAGVVHTELAVVVLLAAVVGVRTSAVVAVVEDTGTAVVVP